MDTSGIRTLTPLTSCWRAHGNSSGGSDPPPALSWPAHSPLAPGRRQPDARPCASLAAVLLIAIALAAYSGGEQPQVAAPAPTAVAASEATSTPAPTAVATTEAASTLAPTAVAASEATSTPEQACANGVAVADPKANPGLVADAASLGLPWCLRYDRLDAAGSAHHRWLASDG